MPTMRYLSLFVAAAWAIHGAHSDPVWNGTIQFWQAFRDADNGLWCDTLYFDIDEACGLTNNRYSSAAVGMGLIIDTILVEIGTLDFVEAEGRAAQTIGSILGSWPKVGFQ